jgi:polyisoprenyl-teichoic acid--peptidoglycan teichoic acid transferase
VEGDRLRLPAEADQMIKRSLLLLLLISVVVGLVPAWGDQGRGSKVLFGRAHDDYQPSRGKLFVLVIGNDARSGNPDRSRADAIHIVGVNTRTMKAGILNFPRDSWVNIPGSGSGRINEALYRGGPQLLVKTIESITHIKIDYWVMTGFQGFQGLIRDIGRVRMFIPKDIYDPTGSGARLQRGAQNLGPINLLAYVRTRHSFSTGDFARSKHQADALIAMLRKLHEEVGRTPGTLLHWIGAVQHHTRLNVGPADLFRLGVLATQMPVRRVGNVTVPGSAGSAGAASVVFLSPSAGRIYARFKRHASL